MHYYISSGSRCYQSYRFVGGKKPATGSADALRGTEFNKGFTTKRGKITETDKPSISKRKKNESIKTKMTQSHPDKDDQMVSQPARTILDLSRQYI